MCKPFQAGDRVAHINLGDGTIPGIDRVGTMTITFDRMRKDGRPNVGIYDECWFQQHPKWIFHREKMK